MSYEQHEWVNGETITAEKMNNIEEGIVEASQSGGGGYDAEVSIYQENNSSSDPVFTVLSGSFADIASKLNENIMPNILVRFWDDLDGTRAISSVTLYYNYFPSASVPSYGFDVFYVVAGSLASFTLVWTAEDEVFFY